MKKIKIEKTKKGFPALWECGGGYTNTGDAVIIANGDGTAKRPVYIRHRGSLACENHALFVVKPGDLVVEVSHHRRDFEVRVWRIDQILEEEARLNLLHEFSMGEWDKEPPAYLEQAIQVAMKKATCYHCRKPHFIIVE